MARDTPNLVIWTFSFHSYFTGIVHRIDWRLKFLLSVNNECGLWCEEKFTQKLQIWYLLSYKLFSVEQKKEVKPWF